MFSVPTRSITGLGWNTARGEVEQWWFADTIRTIPELLVRINKNDFLTNLEWSQQIKVTKTLWIKWTIDKDLTSRKSTARICKTWELQCKIGSVTVVGNVDCLSCRLCAPPTNNVHTWARLLLPWICWLFHTRSIDILFITGVGRCDRAVGLFASFHVYIFLTPFPVSSSSSSSSCFTGVSVRLSDRLLFLFTRAVFFEPAVGKALRAGDARGVLSELLQQSPPQAAIT